ncbi:MAG: hypothetical protein WCG10_01335 [Chlamydiota bacterium]
MNLKQLIGVFVILIGCGLFGISSYITAQVEAGKIEVSSAQRKVNQSKQVLSLNPVTKQVGKGFTDSAQNQINMGKEDIAHYKGVAAALQIGGWIAVGLGALVSILLFNWKKPKRKR